MQDVLGRLDDACARFFAKQSQRPRYKSFTCKQTAGWKSLSYHQHVLKVNGKFKRSRGVVESGGTADKLIQHRPLGGQIKTVTPKRDVMGGL